MRITIQAVADREDGVQLAINVGALKRELDNDPSSGLDLFVVESLTLRRNLSDPPRPCKLSSALELRSDGKVQPNCSIWAKNSPVPKPSSLTNRITARSPH